jgi:hypothetical protein
MQALGREIDLVGKERAIRQHLLGARKGVAVFNQ